MADVRQKVFGGAAVALLLGGGALAAVSATGQSNDHKDRDKLRQARHAARADVAARVAPAGDLQAAASYLGVAVAPLESELRAGKTLAQIANATAGKSAAGLIQALVAGKRARLAARAAKIPQRVSAEVNRSGGPAPHASGARAGRVPLGGAARVAGLFAKPRHAGPLAAGYLGVPAGQLQAELRAGKTLAQVANATAGKSAAGLIDALVAARRERFAASGAAKRLTAAEQTKLLGAFRKHASMLVRRQFAGTDARS